VAQIQDWGGENGIKIFTGRRRGKRRPKRNQTKRWSDFKSEGSKGKKGKESAQIRKEKKNQGVETKKI